MIFNTFRFCLILSIWTFGLPADFICQNICFISTLSVLPVLIRLPFSQLFHFPVWDFDLTQVVSNLFFSSRNLPPSNRDDRTVFGQSNVYFRIHRVQPQLFLYLSDTPDGKKKFQFPNSAKNYSTANWTCRKSNSNYFASVWYWNGKRGKINFIFQFFWHKLFKRPPPIFIPWQIWSVRVLGVKIGDEGKQADAWKTWC